MDLEAAENAYRDPRDQIQYKSLNKVPCPCNMCAKSRKFERDEIIEAIKNHKLIYQKYRGSSFDANGNVLWMKDDVEAYSEAIDAVIAFIKEREPKKEPRKP
jgi:proline dehydrogenase